MVEDDLSTCTVIDGDEKDKYESQSLTFRVGPVFGHPSMDKGLWIEYQEKHMNSPVVGPVLMSKEDWESVRSFIDKKFQS